MKAQLLLIFCLYILPQTQLLSQEEIVKKGNFEKVLAYDYYNLSGQSTYDLRQIHATISPDNYKAVDYQVTTKWNYSIGKVFNRPQEARLSIELEDLSFENLPKYQGVQLKEPFTPEVIFLTLAVKGPDTSFTTKITIEELDEKTSQLLAIHATNSIVIEFTEIYLKYTRTHVMLAKDRVKQIDNLLATKNYLEQLYAESKLISIDNNNPDSILAKNEKFEEWAKLLEKEYYNQDFWVELPSSIISRAKIKSLRKKVDSALEIKNSILSKKVNNIHQSYVQRGYQRLEAKDYAEAIKDVEKAFENQQEYLPAHTLRARIAWEKNGIDESLTHFEEGSRHFSKATPKDTLDFVNLGRDIKSYYLDSANTALNQLAFEESITFYKKADEFCSKYAIVNCQDLNLEKEVQFVRQTQYENQLDSIAKQIDLLQFKSALGTIDSANTFFKKHQLSNIGKYNQLKKQATRGRWDELVTKAGIAEKRAINKSNKSYKRKLKYFERAKKAISQANDFRTTNKSLLSGSYEYSSENLNRHRYDFHFEYAEKYASEGNNKKSLKQFKEAKGFMLKETAEFTNLYKKVFDSEHQALVSSVLKEKEQATVAEKEQLFEAARSNLQNSEEKNETVLKLEESWLSKEEMMVKNSSKELSDAIRQQRIKMGKSAIGYYIKTKEFELAKEFDQYVVSNKGKSDLRNIEKEELFFLRGTGTEAMVQKNYEKAVIDFEKSLEIYNRHKFEGIDHLSLSKHLKEAAKAYALSYYSQQLQKEDSQLSGLEKNQQELEDWVDKYELSKEKDLENLFEGYYKNIGEIIIAKDKNLRNTLSSAIGKKDYILAYQTLKNQNHLLENYDGLYGLDYTQIKQERTEIKNCSEFQQRSKKSLFNINKNTYQKVYELYDLQTQYQTNVGIRKRIDKPSFMPLTKFLDSQSAYVIYRGAEVFNKKNELETAYQLLVSSLQKEYTYKKTESLQKAVAKQLASLDKKNKKYKNKRKGWKGRVPSSLEKKMKVFKKAYKGGW